MQTGSSVRKAPIGIIAYGTALPRWYVCGEDIAQAHGGRNLGTALGVHQKTVPGADEDTATLAVDAGMQACLRCSQDVRLQVGAVFVGSESHPYAVKPTGTIVLSALGLSPYAALADLQFACKAGTQGLQACCAYVRSGFATYGLAIGADCAQSKHGDVLEFTAGAGAAAYLVGAQRKDGPPLLAELVDTVSYATDTPDFWRRPGQAVPEHAGRFSGEPAYFHHIASSVTAMMCKLNTKITQFDHCVFHTPNGKFPRAVAKQLGCTPSQLQYSFLVDRIGNTYAAASLLAFANVLDHAKAGQTILMASYGSGAGSDCFVWRCTPALEKRRATWNRFVEQQLPTERISYADYCERVAGGEG